MYAANTSQQTCLLEAVAASGITAGNIDLAASCANTTATAGIEECATMTCTLREQLSAKNLTETLCERPTHDAPTISVASLIGGSIVVVAYFMRLASKIYFPCQKGARIDNDLWWDDLTITIAFVLLIPITVLSNVLTGLGIGRDIWTLSPENITQALKVSRHYERPTKSYTDRLLDVLHRRGPVSDGTTYHQDCDPLHLPQDLHQ